MTELDKDLYLLIGEINGKVTAILNRLDEVVDRSNKHENKLGELDSRVQAIEVENKSKKAILAVGLSLVSIAVTVAGILIKFFGG